MKTNKSPTFETLENRRLMAVYLDSQINDYMKTAYLDGHVDRKELLDIFRLAGDNNVVDQNEYTDLKELTTKANINGMMKVLAPNIFSSPANKGNDLKVGSTSSELFRLIDKWFLGKDRPATPHGVYKKVEGNLFVNGPNTTDVRQGAVGDCYLMAALASVADKNPKVITEMFTDNGDETWTVKFVNRYGSQNMDYNFSLVVVDKFLPVSSSNRAIYAGWGGGTSTSFRNELWVALLEKAYAQWNETGETKQGNMTNSYDAISGGWSHVVYQQIYPLYVTSGNSSAFPRSEQVIKNALSNNQPVCVYRRMEGGGGHAYYIKSFENGKFTLVNPWGHSHLSQTFEEMKKNCYGYAIAPREVVYYNWGFVLTIPARPTTMTKAQTRAWAAMGSTSQPI
jgi:hypothetical protein